MIVFENKTEVKLEDNLLGDLLGYLRTNRLMSMLMICRQIEIIELIDNVAYLFSSSVDLSELFDNEKHKVELEKFFKEKGLGCKLKISKKEYDPTEKLKEMFGDKLKIN